jgi:cytochrome bd-type quinol oxidase subunit 1
MDDIVRVVEVEAEAEAEALAEEVTVRMVSILVVYCILLILFYQLQDKVRTVHRNPSRSRSYRNGQE